MQNSLTFRGLWSRIVSVNQLFGTWRTFSVLGMLLPPPKTHLNSRFAFVGWRITITANLFIRVAIGNLGTPFYKDLVSFHRSAFQNLDRVAPGTLHHLEEVGSSHHRHHVRILHWKCLRLCTLCCTHQFEVLATQPGEPSIARQGRHTQSYIPTAKESINA